MALCSVQFPGGSIQKASGMNVILPEGDGPFPVLYLLHGLSDDYTIWSRRTSIERYVAELPLVVVMPDGHRSFYCNDPRPGGCAYEDHVVMDVVGFVDRTFRTIAAPAQRLPGRPPGRALEQPRPVGPRAGLPPRQPVRRPAAAVRRDRGTQDAGRVYADGSSSRFVSHGMTPP